MSRETIRKISITVGILTIIGIIFSPSIPITFCVTAIGGAISLTGVRIVKMMDKKPKDFKMQ